MQAIDRIIHLIQHELHFEYIRSSGPGGQNINKVATAVQLRFNVYDSSLPESAKERLLNVARNRISADGVLVIEAKRYRTQEQNRQDAIKRWTALLGKILKETKHRRPTMPTKASRDERLKAKKRKSEIKRSRRGSLFD